MKMFVDLHIHSRFARATSRDMNLDNLDRFTKIKGVDMLGTGDFTHPIWLAELKKFLIDQQTGVYRYKDLQLVMQTEVANIYEKNGRSRKVHNLILAENFDVVDQINEYLSKFGDLKSDGRPALSVPCEEMTEALTQISKNILIIPAHIWTPWFGVFGSKSGFNSLKECFGDQTKNIHAIETGLSSDPAMNWRVKELDEVAIMSNSDCHSYWPWRLGRELNVFEMKEPSYKELIDIVKTRDNKRFLFTMEVDPNYGKYHWDGHRNCNVSLSPSESAKTKSICTVCGRKLTIGVLNRVKELANREESFVPSNAIPFKTMLPLAELLAAMWSTEPFSKKVLEEEYRLVKQFGNEIKILLEVPEEYLKQTVDQKVVELIIKNREGKIRVQPGYDGVYGQLMLDENQKIKSKSPQKTLSSFNDQQQ